MTSLLLLVGCTPAPNRAATTVQHPAPPVADGTVVVGATATSSTVTPPAVLTPGATPTFAPIEVKAPIVSNNGGSVIHGTVRIPASILANNGGNIVSPNGGTIVSPNGGTIVSPNGGTIVSPNGGTIVSPNGGTIVSPNGGTIVSPNGGTLKLAQVPMRFAEVKLTDAAGTPVKDDKGVDLVSKTDGDGNYSFPVDVKGRNLVVHAVVPGQSEELLGLLSKSGADAPVPVDLNSTLSMSYILQKFVNGDVSTFERLEPSAFEKATIQTDSVLASGNVTLPSVLSATELAKKVDQIRLRSGAADAAFEDIRKLLVALGITNEGNGLKAVEVYLGTLEGGCLTPDGSIFLFSQTRHTLWRVDPAGVIHTIVAGGSWGYPEVKSGPVPITLAGIVVNEQGFVYLTDAHNNRIVRISPNGEVITVAGTGEAGFSGDGKLAIEAKLNLPTGLSIDSAGVITFSDTGNGRIRRITANGEINTIVGDASSSEELDATAPGGVHLKDAQGIALDASGRLLIADGGHHRILEVTPSAVLTRVLNDSTRLSRPVSLAIQNNDILILDIDATRPMRIVNGLIASTDWSNSLNTSLEFPVSLHQSSIICANGSSVLVGDGSAYLFSGNFESGFKKVVGINPQDADNLIDQGVSMAIDKAGTVFVLDQPGGRLFRKIRGGILNPVAGVRNARQANVDYSLIDYSNALLAPLSQPTGMCIDPVTGEPLVVVSDQHPSVRRLTKSGSLLVDRKSFSVNIKQLNGSTEVKTFTPAEIAVTRSGTTYLSGAGIGIVFQSDNDNAAHLVLGTNLLANCVALSLDSQDRLYFINSTEKTVYRVDGESLVSVLETDKVLGPQFGRYIPEAFAIDRAGNKYITEGFHVYRIDALSKKVELIAGPGGKYFSGTTRDASLKVVTRLLFTDDGDLYLLDRDQVKLLTASQLSEVP